MKKFDYVYFTIYHYCSRQSYFHDSLSVRMKCMYLLALSAGGWLLLLQQLFMRYVRLVWFSSHEGAMFNALTIYAAVTYVFYRIFIVGGKDQKIFDKYVNSWENNPNKKRDLLVASFVAAVPYISMFCLKLLVARQ